MASSAFVRTNAILRCKMLVGRCPNPMRSASNGCRLRIPAERFCCVSMHTLSENPECFLVQASMAQSRHSWENKNVVCLTHEKERTDAEMEQLYLMPGEERYTKFQDENGVPKVRYTYCSLHGRLFNCTCKTMDEAQRLCEDWLVTQDRCYIN